MLIKEIIEEFGYCQPQITFIGLGRIQKEIYFQGDACQSIAISNKFNHRVWFGITNDVFNTKTIKLSDDGDLSNNELIELSKILNFNLEYFAYSNEYQKAIANNYSPLYLAFQWCMGRFYCLIYGSKSTNNFVEDILYVHGIWEIELSQAFKKKIFGEIWNE
jgi:hypothetical protein